MHCLLCVNDSYFIYDDNKNNCYSKEELLLTQKYYLSNNDSMFHECYYTCSKCDNYEPNEDIHYCINCSTNYYFLENTTNCYNFNLTQNGYYLDNSTLEPIFKKCYESCKTCIKYKENKGNIEIHNCIDCADYYYKLEKGLYPYNCYDNDTINSLIYIEDSTINTQTFMTTYIDESESNSNNIFEEDSSFKTEETIISEDIFKTSSTINTLIKESTIEITEKHTQEKNSKNYDLFSTYINSDEIMDSSSTSSTIQSISTTQLSSSEIEASTLFSSEIPSSSVQSESTTQLSSSEIETSTLISSEILSSTIQSESTTQLSSSEIETSTPFSSEIQSSSVISESTTQLSSSEIETSAPFSSEIPSESIVSDKEFTNTNEKYNVIESQTLTFVKDEFSSSLVTENTEENDYFIEHSSNQIDSTEVKITIIEESLSNSDNTFEITEKSILSTDNYFECDISCLECNKEYDNNNTNCLECNTEKGYYPLYNDNSSCYNNITIIEGYYLDKNENYFIWKQCRENCEKCNMLISLDGDCVFKCPNGTYKYSLNNSCINECPDNYIIYNNECILKDNEQEIIISEFKNKIFSDINLYKNTTQVINGTNYIVAVSSSDISNCVLSLMTSLKKE